MFLDKLRIPFLGRTRKETVPANAMPLGYTTPATKKRTPWKERLPSFPRSSKKVVPLDALPLGYRPCDELPRTHTAGSSTPLPAHVSEPQAQQTPSSSHGTHSITGVLLDAVATKLAALSVDHKRNHAFVDMPPEHDWDYGLPVEFTETNRDSGYGSGSRGGSSEKSKDVEDRLVEIANSVALEYSDSGSNVLQNALALIQLTNPEGYATARCNAVQKLAYDAISGAAAPLQIVRHLVVTAADPAADQHVFTEPLGIAMSDFTEIEWRWIARASIVSQILDMMERAEGNPVLKDLRNLYHTVRPHLLPGNGDGIVSPYTQESFGAAVYSFKYLEYNELLMSSGLWKKHWLPKIISLDPANDSDDWFAARHAYKVELAHKACAIPFSDFDAEFDQLQEYDDDAAEMQTNELGLLVYSACWRKKNWGRGDHNCDRAVPYIEFCRHLAAYHAVEEGRPLPYPELAAYVRNWSVQDKRLLRLGEAVSRLLGLTCELGPAVARLAMFVRCSLVPPQPKKLKKHPGLQKYILNVDSLENFLYMHAHQFGVSRREIPTLLSLHPAYDEEVKTAADPAAKEQSLRKWHKRRAVRFPDMRSRQQQREESKLGKLLFSSVRDELQKKEYKAQYALGCCFD